MPCAGSPVSCRREVQAAAAMQNCHHHAYQLPRPWPKTRQQQQLPFWSTLDLTRAASSQAPASQPYYHTKEDPR